MVITEQFRLQCEQIVQDLQLGNPSAIERIETLAGGVSSDIAVVHIGGQRICVKCALPTLKVSAAWHAPVRRNLAEYRWLQFAAKQIPDAVPGLLGRSERANGFAMAYIDPQTAPNYKQRLLDGHPDTGQASRIGAALALVQSASTRPDFDASAFDNAPDFHALRLEPYLEYTAARHPNLAQQLLGLSANCNSARIALVHGDVSPKNILVGQNGPIFLDAECATFGEPAFDPAFFLNHLLIKAHHLPASAPMLHNAARQFWEHYSAGVSWEPATEIQTRCCALLPALMLARIDGKSPVEYLSDAARESFRAAALSLLESKPRRLDRILTHLQTFGDPQ